MAPLLKNVCRKLWNSPRNAAELRPLQTQIVMQMFELEGRPTGELRFEFVHGKTAVTTAYARYPLKFVSATRASDGGCSWVYTLGYGGGAVCGDQVTISCCVGEECTAALTTQGSTKVYKRTARVRNGGTLEHEHEHEQAHRASQSLLSRVSRGGLLAIVPDPVTCFKDSSFRQHQRFLLERGSSLVLVDWLTSGRMSRGEGWAFSRLESRNEVMVQTASPADPEPRGQGLGWEALVLDSLVLEELLGLSIRERMLGMNVVGVVILLGPRVEGLVATVLQIEAGKRPRFPPGLETKRGAHGGVGAAAGEGAGGPSAQKAFARGGGKGRTIFSVSPLHGGCDAWCRGLVYRFAAERTEDARALLHDLLLPLKEVLGGRAAFSLEGGSS